MISLHPQPCWLQEGLPQLFHLARSHLRHGSQARQCQGPHPGVSSCFCGHAHSFAFRSGFEQQQRTGHSGHGCLRRDEGTTGHFAN